MRLLPSREARHSGGPCENTRPFGILAFGTAGATGSSSLGVTAFGILHAASAYKLPGGVWLALIAANLVTALVSSIALVLKYKINKMTIEARMKEAQSVAELKKARQEIHRIVLEKAAGEPASASAYRELIIADAVHLSVEQGTPAPADRTHTLLQPALDDAPAPQAAQPRSRKIEARLRAMHILGFLDAGIRTFIWCPYQLTPNKF